MTCAHAVQGLRTLDDKMSLSSRNRKNEIGISQSQSRPGELIGFANC